ncbi:MAG: hypothetical protein AB7W47_05260 [Calditrichaceae bacterium]
MGLSENYPGEYHQQPQEVANSLVDSGVNFKHTDYDLIQAANQISKSNYPRADEFALKCILSAPSVKDMLEMLTGMEVNL